ncbi:unnamed protein product [Echinostoma caproni]|uniref:Thioredoxin_16 domain-containing protein n=1 Tax=Echinostoma caproni TaxID=27848 RepID=A0A183AIT7_9TREM|nr:unnamed protein product [Echinostoma caproni]
MHDWAKRILYGYRLKVLFVQFRIKEILPEELVVDFVAMYAVQRLIEPVHNFVHTDSMYPVKSCSKGSGSEDITEENELEPNMCDRLNSLEESISHLLKLFKEAKKHPLKSSTTVIKTTQQHPVATPVLSQKLATPLATVVVQANPDNPPIAALLYCQTLAQKGIHISLFSYVHSTVHEMPAKLDRFLKSLSVFGNPNSSSSLCVRIVWNGHCPDCVTFTDIKATFLYGESMLIQKLLSLVEPDAPQELTELLTTIDKGLLLIPSLRQSTISLLQSHSYLTKPNRSSPSAVDCFLYVCARKSDTLNCLPANWLKICTGFQSIQTLNLLFDK